MNLMKREWMKITRLPALRWIIGFMVLFQLYAYGSVALQFDHLKAQLMAQFQWSDAQVLEFLGTAPGTDPLLSLATIVSLPMVFSYNLALLSVIGPFFAVILASQLIGNEYSNGTIRHLWTQGIPRIHVLLGKVAALLSLFLALIAAACLLGMGLSILVTTVWDIPDLSQQSLLATIPLAANQWGITLLGWLLWASLAAMIAAVTRSALAGAIVGIGYPTAELMVLAGSKINVFFPLWNQRSTLPPVFEGLGGMGVVGFPPQPGMVPFAVGIWVTLAYTLVFLTVLYLVWRRQEIA